MTSVRFGDTLLANGPRVSTGGPFRVSPPRTYSQRQHPSRVCTWARMYPAAADLPQGGVMANMLGKLKDWGNHGCGRGCCCDVHAMRRTARARDKRQKHREIAEQRS